MASCVLASIALIGFGQALSAVASILWLALLGLALSGLWPTLLIHAGRIIQANPPTLFSLLAMAGLAGCSSCSWGVGFLSDAGYSLQVGLSALIVPVLAALLALALLSFARDKEATSDH
jgi:fucose permease